MSVMSKEFFRYLPVSEVDRKWGLYVTGAGRLTVGAGEKYPLKIHPGKYQFTWPQRRVLGEYQVLYITRGQGEFECEQVARRNISAGSIILTFPDQWHSYRPTPATGWSQLWFGFNGDLADRLVCENFISPRDPIIHVGENDSILQAFGRLLDHTQSGMPGAQQFLAGIVLEVLASVLTAMRLSGKNDRHWELVQRVKSAMEPETGEKQTIEHLAGSVGMSQVQLRRIFKSHTGLSPYQYRIQICINRSKELLQGTSLTIKEIASILNFENPYHFSAAFKKKTGTAPAYWRNGRRTRKARRS